MIRGVKRQAPAKINLGLWVRGRRPDGYHEIETIFVPVPELADELHVELAPNLDQPKLELTGVDVPGRLEDNLCLRAWTLLRDEFGERVPPVRMVLEKHIPVGAGLGGGSSDAASCLLAFDELFGLQLGVAGLRPYAQVLGADVPFFLNPRPSWACGIGDELEAIELPNLGRIDVRFLGVHSDTGLAYRNLDLGQCTAGGSLREAVRQPCQHWSQLITNDFEQEVFVRFPELAREKSRLYAQGAYFALMSGSGSAVYGLFA